MSRDRSAPGVPGGPTHKPAARSRLSPQAEAALGRLRVELNRERYKEAQIPAPRTLDHLAVALGLPVALDEDELELPWSNWAACLLAAAFGAHALRNQPEESFDTSFMIELGLAPANAPNSAASLFELSRFGAHLRQRVGQRCSSV